MFNYLIYKTQRELNKVNRFLISLQDKGILRHHYLKMEITLDYERPKIASGSGIGNWTDKLQNILYSSRSNGIRITISKNEQRIWSHLIDSTSDLKISMQTLEQQIKALVEMEQVKQKNEKLLEYLESEHPSVMAELVMHGIVSTDNEES